MWSKRTPNFTSSSSELIGRLKRRTSHTVRICSECVLPVRFGYLSRSVDNKVSAASALPVVICVELMIGRLWREFSRKNDNDRTNLGLFRYFELVLLDAECV